MIPRVLVVGCGAVVEDSHAPALRRLAARGELEVAALCDPSPARVESLRRHFPGARPLSSLEGIGPGLADVALVATPVGLHAAQTVACLEAGLDVLCEKPMAATAAEADAMIRAAESRGRHLAVGQVRRFFAAARYIRETIEQGRLGPLRSFRAREGGAFNWDAKSASFFVRQTAGGGVLIDTGAHSLDLLVWWLGEPRGFAYADDAMGGVEANCRLELDYGAFRGELRLTRDYGTRQEYELLFERGWIRWLPYSADRLQLGQEGAESALDCGLLCVEPGSRDPRPVATYHRAFEQQWRNLLAARQGREALRAPGREAAKSIRLIEQCYLRRSLLESPWFGADELARARQLGAGAAP